jgi:hypothetical protein
MSHGSSRTSAPAFVLRAERSGALILWWGVLHGVVGASLAMLPVAGAARLIAAALLLAHAAWRRPRQGRQLLLYRNGYWAVPDRGRFGLQAAAGTAYTALWLRLVLADAQGGTVCLLLLRDQFAAETWRKIQVAVRECDNVLREAAVPPPV